MICRRGRLLVLSMCFLRMRGFSNLLMSVSRCKISPLLYLGYHEYNVPSQYIKKFLQVPYGGLKWQKWAMHFSLSMQHNLSNLVYNLPRYLNSRELVFVLLHWNVL